MKGEGCLIAFCCLCDVTGQELGDSEQQTLHFLRPHDLLSLARPQEHIPSFCNGIGESVVGGE